jgi:hypothetical protein
LLRGYRKPLLVGLAIQDEAWLRRELPGFVEWLGPGWRAELFKMAARLVWPRPSRPP